MSHNKNQKRKKKNLKNRKYSNKKIKFHIKNWLNKINTRNNWEKIKAQKLEPKVKSIFIIVSHETFIGQLKGFSNSITDLAYNETIIVASSFDSTIRVFDL